MGGQEYGIEHARLMQYAHEIEAIADHGVEIAVVIGGGNIYRGMQAANSGFDRVQGDHMGMLATVINSSVCHGINWIKNQTSDRH